MRTLPLACLLVFAPALCGAAPHKDDTAAVRKALTARYASVSRAFQKKDAAAMAAIMAPDYVAVQPGGRELDREQVLADFKRQMEALSSVRWPRKIEKLEVKDGEAKATVRGRLSGDMVEPKGKRHRLVVTAVTHDTWTKGATGWLIKRSEVAEMQMTLDGKSGPGAPPAKP